MRKLFGSLLASEMQKNPDIWLLAGDVGYGILDEAFKVAPDRCINMGASEQLMIGAAVGLSYEGKLPICYTITPFLLLRPYEWIRNYLQQEGANVKLVGSGRDRDYANLGSTHWCTEDYDLFSLGDEIDGAFSNIEYRAPWDKGGLEYIFPEFLYNSKPTYLNLKR